MRVLKGCLISLGEILTTYPRNSVLRVKGALENMGLGYKLESD